MQVLFISGGTKEPATRFRVTQLLRHFEAAGICCTRRFAYGGKYNAVHDTPLARPYKLLCRLKRAVQTLAGGRYDAVFLQRTAFNGTAWPEKLAAQLKARIIYDYDDAVFLDSKGAPNSRRRIAFGQVVELAAHVIAGNQYLAQEAGDRANISVIPTVIDTDTYTPQPSSTPVGELTIGWMGTASNFKFFDSALVAVMEVLKEFPKVKFRMVSNSTYPGLLNHPQVIQSPWTEEQELADLRSFDIGVMPLIDSPWTRGKCAFKLIQYMAVACPVIASAVGANIELLEGTGAGFLVRDVQDWISALRCLLADGLLRREMGIAARNRIVKNYSVVSVFPAYMEILNSIATRRGHPRSAALRR